MWPTENPWPAMIVLVCLAVVFLGQYGSKRKIVSMVLAVLSLLGAGGCYLLDLYVLTPREQIIQNVYDLAAAFQKQDVPKTLGFFSQQAIAERTLIETALRQVRVNDDLRITDLAVNFKAADSLAISHFRANASLHVSVVGINTDVSYHPSRWELDWQREAGEWKVVKVHRLHPINGKEVSFMSAE